jgi:hypothetical protein
VAISGTTADVACTGISTPNTGGSSQQEGHNGLLKPEEASGSAAYGQLQPPPILRIGMPETTKLDWTYRLEAIGDLKERAYQALCQDSKDQGIPIALPDLSELQLRRRWVFHQKGKSGFANVGSYVGFLQTSLVCWLWSQRAPHHKTKQDTADFLTATHEMAHSVGGVTFISSEHLSGGWPIVIRRGLLLIQPVSHGALFHALEELHASLTELRAGKRLGLPESRTDILTYARRSSDFLSRAERGRLLGLLNQFDLGETAWFGDRVIRVDAPTLNRFTHRPPNTSRGYLPLLGGIEKIVHHTLQRETSAKSLAEFSQLLGHAHAGDFSAFRAALAILRQAVGSDGVRILSLVRPAVRRDSELVSIVAAAVGLPEIKRRDFLKKLYQLVCGELMLSEQLREGRVPTVSQVYLCASKRPTWAGTVQDWTNFALRRHVVIPQRLRNLATAACAGALARGDRFQAYRILVNCSLPPSTWPREMCDELANTPKILKLLAHTQRSFGLLSAFVTSTLRRFTPWN